MTKRKFDQDDRVVGRDDGPADFRGSRGTVVEIGPGKAEYGVIFENRSGTVEYVMSNWFDLVKPESGAHE